MISLDVSYYRYPDMGHFFGTSAKADLQESPLNSSRFKLVEQVAGWSQAGW